MESALPLHKKINAMGPGEGGEGRGERGGGGGFCHKTSLKVLEIKKKKKTNMIKVPSSTQQTQESNCKYFVLDGGKIREERGRENYTGDRWRTDTC